MHSGGPEDRPSPKELEERIRDYLFATLRTLTSLNLDISLYLWHHDNQNPRRDPFGGNGLDDAYTLYEERANDCRRLWMKLRAASEKRTSLTKAAGNSSPPRSRLDLERSSSPLEYQSAIEENEPAETRRNNQVTPMDVDPVEMERDIPRPSTPVIDLPPKSKLKNGDPPALRSVIITPSGPTRCRLAPIPKGAKLSVETTRVPAPHKPYTFNMPRQPIGSDSEKLPLNRTKHNNRGAQSSQNTSSSFSSLQSSNQRAGPSTTRTSVSSSCDYSSAREYWEPRRPIRPGDFQMDKDRLFNSLDCLGPPFPVDMSDITHNNTPATQVNLSSTYGGKLGFIPKIPPEKLAIHGFDHWMTPNMEYHPFLPAQPGWPGLMLRSDDDLEEWGPEGGSEFRVVIKREPQFLEYVGQYEMVRLGDITGDEWKKQPAKVKNGWTRVLGGGRLWNDVAARVALRKRLGKEPLIEDLAKFASKSTPDDYATLARDLKGDIDRAFCTGEEVIAVWGMKCVDYDFKFEKHLARSLKAIKPSPPGSAKKRKTVVENSDDFVSGGEDVEKEENSESDDSPTKRQRLAKGKAKLMKYDWTGARIQGDSEDEDYKPT